jgi:hypothetical protein
MAFSSRASQQNFLPLWKLTYGIVTFAILNGAYAVWIIFLMSINQCHFVVNFKQKLQTLGVMRVILMIRIFLDPVISGCTDLEARKQPLLLQSPPTLFLHLIIHLSKTVSDSKFP